MKEEDIKKLKDKLKEINLLIEQTKIKNETLKLEIQEKILLLQKLESELQSIEN